MGQLVVGGLVLLVFLGYMGLRVWTLLRRRTAEERDAAADRLERWARHVTRGGDEG